MEVFKRLIKELEVKFKKDDRVYALWLEGSYAGDNYDEHSDIDIWLDVDDDSLPEIWTDVEKLLNKFGRTHLIVEKPVTHNHHDRSYKIEGLPETAHIDFNIEKHSRIWWLTEGNADPDIKIIFDKDKILQWRKPNLLEQKAHAKGLAREYYGRYHAYSKSGVIRNIRRGNYLEAVGYYLQALDELLVLMRLKYQPTKPDFQLKHIQRDVPQEVQEILTGLYKFNNLKDIQQNLNEVDELIEQYANHRN